MPLLRRWRQRTKPHGAQFDVGLAKTFEQFINRIESPADDAVAAHLGGVLWRDADRDRILVDVYTDNNARFYSWVFGFVTLLSTTQPQAGSLTLWIGPLRRITHVYNRNQTPARSLC